ncbi:MAG: 4'-phosphopantetheinyl transferase, partial [Candidatus Daviesbacteria bacterium GW2011_GWF2_38_7]
FKNLYVETAAQALGLGGRDTDVLERLPSATIGAFKGAADGLAQSLTFGWWNPEIKYANDIEEQAGKMTEVEFNVIGTVGTFLVGGGLVAGALKGIPLLARAATIAPRTFSLLSNGLTFAGLTQVQKDEAQKDAGQRAKDFVSDFALGGAFSIAGMKPSFFKSSAIIGPATYVTSLLKGDSNEDALKNTAAMMGLHSLNFAVAKYLPYGGNPQKQMEKATGEQLNITKQEALKYLGVEEKATAEQIKQAWKNKVVEITKAFPAQAKQTPQKMGQFNQAWNTANRAYEFITKASNPAGYTGKSFRQEFQDLYYELWQTVPDKRALIVITIRNLPAGLSVRATLEDSQRNEIITALGGENAKTRLGRVAELTDADLVAVAMENNIKVSPSKGILEQAIAEAAKTPKATQPTVERTEIWNVPGDLMPVKGKPTWKHSKMLWNTMRNQYGMTNTWGKDITKNKGAVFWIIDTLENGLASKKDLMAEARKTKGVHMDRYQYKKLYAMFKSHDYDIEGYKKVMATLKGLKPAVIEKTQEFAAKAQSPAQPVSISEPEVKPAEGFQFDPNSTVNQGKVIVKDSSIFEKGTFFRQKGKDTGVSYLMGKNTQTGNTEVQTIYFDKKLFAEEKAAKWWTKNADRFIKPWSVKEEKLPSTPEPKHVSEITKEGTIRVVRYSTEKTVNTDEFRGGTWYATPESKTFDFSKEEGIGGNLKTETAVEVKNPLVIKGANTEDGSFAVVNEGYENFLPEQQKNLANELWERIHTPEEIPDETETEGIISDILIRNGDGKDQIANVVKSSNKIDAAMDLIISKGLKVEGYDALILTNTYKDQEIDRHVFKFIKETEPTVKPLITDKFTPAEQKAARAEEIRLKYRPEEKELLDVERIPSIGEIMRSTKFKDRISGKVTAPDTPRADELKDAPSGQPPRSPEETPLSGSTPPPEGSALSAIDAMVGKKSAVRNIGEMITGAIRSFPRLFTDRFAAIRKFEDDVSKLQGQPIDINSSPYVAARMYAGRFGIVEGSFRDLQKILESVRKLRPDFTRFVLAQRAIERGERGFQNPAGVTQETAKQALEELRAKVGEKVYQQFEQAGQNIQDWSINTILKPMKNAGILSNEAFNAITEKNKHWMPFHVLDYLPSPEQADKIPIGSDTFSVSKQGVVKALEGTEKIIRDPFESILDNLTKAVSLTKRNEVARKLIDLRNVHPEAKEFIKFLPGDQRPQEGWDSISVFIKGKAIRWALPNELSEAMHAMTPPEANLLGKMILLSSKAFKAGTTTLYFPFTLSNAIRDYQTATMVSKWGFNPAVWLSGFGDGLKGAFKWESKAYDEFMRNEGGYGGYIQSAKGLAIASKELFAPQWMQRTKAVLNPFELISNFSEAIELAPRLGIYKKGIGKEGVTPLEAAFEARNVTVDFAKAGIEGRLINMWIPFVNARWQGLLNVGRVMKDNPLRTAARALAMTVLPGVATYFYNVMNHEELWDDIPQWAKDTYFIIIVGEEKDKDGNTVPKVVQIPKGDIGAIFFNPIMYALEYVRKQEPQNLFALGLEWTSQLSPVPFTRDGELSAQAFLGGALPPALKTPIELATNTNFFTGFPVVPRKLEKVAPSEQYDERTPELAITVGRASGVSPMKLTHAIYGLTGSFSKELINPTDILGMTAQRFYRASGGEKQRLAWDLKYDTEVGYNTTRLQIQKAMQEGNMQEAQRIATEWNTKAAQIVPVIVPLLMKDDPKEAASFQKSVTFGNDDIQRLLKLNPPAENTSQPKGSEIRGIKNLLRGSQPPAGASQAQPTMGQFFPGNKQSGDDQTIKNLIYR